MALVFTLGTRLDSGPGMRQEPLSDPRTVPTRHTRALLRLLADDTFVEPLLDQCDLSLSALQQQPTTPLYQYCKLFVLISHAAQFSLHGKEAERILRLSSYNLIQSAMLRAQDMLGAIEILDSHLLRMAPGTSTTEVLKFERSATWSFQFDSGQHESELSWSREDFSMAGLNWLGGILGSTVGMWMWHRCISWMIGSYIDLDKVTLTAPRPEHPDHYAPLFCAPIYYGQRTNSLHFSARYLEFPVVRTRTAAEELQENYLYTWASLQYQDDSICMRIKNLIGNDFSRRLPTLEVIARQLNMSVAAVHRQLKKESSTYQQLKDDCRHEAALIYLRRKDMSISEIATHLGFSDSSTFHRAFKSWSGLTPNQVRHRLL